MSWFSNLAERHLQRAAAQGKLQCLAGQGNPLDLPQGVTDATQELGFRIMADAGVLPEEFTLKKQTALHLATLTDDADRNAGMSTLAQSKLRQAIPKEARHRFMA
jgi:hypothetical protein